jgi:hypothetical protein
MSRKHRIINVCVSKLAPKKLLVSWFLSSEIYIMLNLVITALRSTYGEKYFFSFLMCVLYLHIYKNPFAKLFINVQVLTKTKRNYRKIHFLSI